MMWWKVKNEMPSGSAISSIGIGRPSTSPRLKARKLAYLNSPSTARLAAIAAVTIHRILVLANARAASQLIRIDNTKSGRNGGLP